MCIIASLPLWERGLKLDEMLTGFGAGVAPFVGAWIEIFTLNSLQIEKIRSLCGSVD